MLYSVYRKKIKGCPFCNSVGRFIIENKLAMLTYAIAPYHRHHLLVIPKRHVVSFLKLTSTENRAIQNLIIRGAKIMEGLGYSNYSILIREGTNGAKSIPHMHYHIIPNHRIGDLDHKNKQRLVMTDSQIKKTITDVKKVLRKN